MKDRAKNIEASVIVPAYEESEWIPETLTSLEDQNAEVVVVASGKETLKAAREHPCSDLVLEDEKENGWGSAVNQGIEEASREIVLITDADTLVPENWVESHLEHYRDDNVAGVGGPAVAREPGFHKFTSDFYALYILPVLWRAGFKLMIGNNCSYRRKQLLEAGGLNEDMSFLEDVEIALRINEEGKVVFDRNIRTQASVRRIQEKGILSILATYLKGHWKYFFKGSNSGTSYH